MITLHGKYMFYGVSFWLFAALYGAAFMLSFPFGGDWSARLFVLGLALGHGALGFRLMQRAAECRIGKRLKNENRA
jgi:hypothetical protein